MKYCKERSTGNIAWMLVASVGTNIAIGAPLPRVSGLALLGLAGLMATLRVIEWFTESPVDWED